jgi:hypothetical protein
MKIIKKHFFTPIAAALLMTTGSAQAALEGSTTITAKLPVFTTVYDMTIHGTAANSTAANAMDSVNGKSGSSSTAVVSAKIRFGETADAKVKFSVNINGVDNGGSSVANSGAGYDGGTAASTANCGITVIKGATTVLNDPTQSSTTYDYTGSSAGSFVKEHPTGSPPTASSFTANQTECNNAVPNSWVAGSSLIPDTTGDKVRWELTSESITPMGGVAGGDTPSLTSDLSYTTVSNATHKDSITVTTPGASTAGETTVDFNIVLTLNNNIAAARTLNNTLIVTLTN